MEQGTSRGMSRHMLIMVLCCLIPLAADGHFHLQGAGVADPQVWPDPALSAEHDAHDGHDGRSRPRPRGRRVSGSR
jgi:hypothetical protein